MLSVFMYGKKDRVPRVTQWGNARLTAVRKRSNCQEPLRSALRRRTVVPVWSYRIITQGTVRGEHCIFTQIGHRGEQRGEQCIITQASTRVIRKGESVASSPKAAVSGESNASSPSHQRYYIGLSGESKASSPNLTHTDLAVQTL